MLEQQVPAVCTFLLRQHPSASLNDCLLVLLSCHLSLPCVVPVVIKAALQRQVFAHPFLYVLHVLPSLLPATCFLGCGCFLSPPSSVSHFIQSLLALSSVSRWFPVYSPSVYNNTFVPRSLCVPLFLLCHCTVVVSSRIVGFGIQ